MYVCVYLKNTHNLPKLLLFQTKHRHPPIKAPTPPPTYPSPTPTAAEILLLSHF